jgi:hypothetical protein
MKNWGKLKFGEHWKIIEKLVKFSHHTRKKKEN